VIFSENIEFCTVLSDEVSYSESSGYSAELKIIIPRKETRKGQGKKNNQPQPPGGKNKQGKNQINR
jgi:hypothetical protein